MGQESPGFWGGFGFGQSIKRWKRALRSPATVSTADLRRMAGDIQTLRDELDQMAAAAGAELQGRGGSGDGIARPEQCDWAIRPAPWTIRMRPHGIVGLGSPTELNGGVTLYHDATRAQMSLRQDPTPPNCGTAPFGLVLEVYELDGSFVSLVQDLPAASLEGLTKGHFIAVQITAERDHPIDVYARLNIQHGPNVEQMVREIEFKGDLGRAEFDLAYSKVNEKRLEKAWLDLIIEGPTMTRIALWDMSILRAPRADI
ncbi:DUF6478 family protein [Gymnodinialimonas sp. 2305UL16-5]|uniref:DUF6478 family protein n=1 Tax=Gymnodinialimonas mytili TaxID=3126503 RepID=UPI00309EAB78